MHGHDTDSHWLVCLLCLLAVAWAVLLRVKPYIALAILLLGVAGCFFRGPVAGKIAP